MNMNLQTCYAFTSFVKVKFMLLFLSFFFFLLSSLVQAAISASFVIVGVNKLGTRFVVPVIILIIRRFCIIDV